jgi:Fe-S cluster biogenesis protein NfuA
MAMHSKGRRKGDQVESRIRDAIVAMRPLLRIETVDIDLLSFEAETGVTALRVAGDCPDCKMSATVLRTAIEAHLRMRVPEITEVRISDTPGAATHG